MIAGYNIKCSELKWIFFPWFFSLGRKDRQWAQTLKKSHFGKQQKESRGGLKAKSLWLQLSYWTTTRRPSSSWIISISWDFPLSVYFWCHKFHPKDCSVLWTFMLVMFIFLSSNPSSWKIFKTCICIFVFLQCVLLSAFIHFQLLCQRTRDDWSPSRDTMKQHWVYLVVFFFANLPLLE